MNRSRPRLVFLALAVLAFAPAALRAQDESQIAGLRIKPGFHVEYFSRTLSWDGDTRTSTAVLPTGYVTLDFELARGFSIGILGGYSLTDYSGLVFRQLPFSIDYEAGSIGGYVLGGQVQKSLVTSGFWEITAEAKFTAYMGTTQIYTIDALNQTGELDAKGNWMRVQVGTNVIYRGFELFSPFIGAAYDKFWGTFTATETIEDLTGAEEKSIAGKGVIAVNFGTIYEPSPNFSLKITATVIPYNKGTGLGLGVDYGGSVRAVFSF